MTSIKTQLPYEYYSLKFCEPKVEREYKIENLGLFIHCSTSYLFYICLNLLQESFYMETISVYRVLSIMSSFTASFFFLKFELQSSHEAINFLELKKIKDFSLHPWWSCVWNLSHHHVTYCLQYIYYSTSFLICRWGSQRWQNCQYSLWGNVCLAF